MTKNAVLVWGLWGLAGAAAALALGSAQAGPDIPADVQKVFKQHCVRCHTGPKPPKGLSLIPGKIASAIGAPSAEVPTMKLIEPGATDASYLLKKVRREEGVAGKPMPPGRALAPEEIRVLEDWIAGLAK
jgi:mono/diheme cytochrome c family protein